MLAFNLDIAVRTADSYLVVPYFAAMWLLGAFMIMKNKFAKGVACIALAVPIGYTAHRINVYLGVAVLIGLPVCIAVTLVMHSRWYFHRTVDLTIVTQTRHTGWTTTDSKGGTNRLTYCRHPKQRPQASLIASARRFELLELARQNEYTDHDSEEET